MIRLTTLFLMLLLVAGCTGEESATQGEANQEETGSVDTSPAESNQITAESFSRKPVNYEAESGQFQVTFPTGCGKLFVRANEPDLFAGETQDDIILVEFVSCDRYQEKGEGYSITGTYNYHDKYGEMAGPDEVVRRVEEALSNFGAQIVEQKPIRRDFGQERVAEGVRVTAVGAEGNGEVLIFGLLVDGDLYVMSAWNTAGGLMEDPEAVAFFDSFRPFVE